MTKLSEPITDLSKPLIDHLAIPVGSSSSSMTHSQKSIRKFVQAGMSHVSGDTTTPLLELSIPELVNETVRNHSKRTAVVFCDQDIRKTWQEFATDIDRLAAGFLALGLKKGDRLGIWSPNRYEWLLTQFATARTGVILVTINPAYRISELKHVLETSGCKALVMAQKFKSSNYVEMLLQLKVNAFTSGSSKSSLSNLEHAIIIQNQDQSEIPVGMYAFSEIMDLSGPAHILRLEEISAHLNPDDAINIQFTSGTTGLPKGATLSHRNILNNGKFVTDAQGFMENDTLCIPVPLYHCFGMVMGALGCATKGAAMVFPSESFVAKDTVRAIAREGCTALYGVPTMFNAILNLEDFDSYDLTSLRTGVMAGAPCPIETMKRVVDDMHMTEVTIAYGMTETSPVSFQSNLDDPIEMRVSKVGRVHPHVECRVIDGEGNTVPVGQQGELCTRGYSVMKGYWNDPTQTRASIDTDGWMHSGDLAIIDNMGYCNIVGRVKDMIIRGGENIYPKEIEEYLHQHPGIQDVQVFGVPDHHLGEEVCAWVVPVDSQGLSEQDIIAFCKGQIAHYKVPRYVRIRNDLPMTVTGKAQKYKMREAMLKELKLENHIGPEA